MWSTWAFSKAVGFLAFYLTVSIINKITLNINASKTTVSDEILRFLHDQLKERMDEIL